MSSNIPTDLCYTESHEWARANALPFARSAIDAPALTALHRDVGLPLVAKPRLGFGSNGVRILMTPAHVNAALNRPDLNTLSTPGPKGYNDYPVLP